MKGELGRILRSLSWLLYIQMANSRPADLFDLEPISSDNLRRPQETASTLQAGAPQTKQTIESLNVPEGVTILTTQVPYNVFESSVLHKELPPAIRDSNKETTDLEVLPMIDSGEKNDQLLLPTQEPDVSASYSYSYFVRSNDNLTSDPFQSNEELSKIQTEGFFSSTIPTISDFTNTDGLASVENIFDKTYFYEETPAFDPTMDDIPNIFNDIEFKSDEPNETSLFVQMEGSGFTETTEDTKKSIERKEENLGEEGSGEYANYEEISKTSKLPNEEIFSNRPFEDVYSSVNDTNKRKGKTRFIIYSTSTETVNLKNSSFDAEVPEKNVVEIQKLSSENDLTIKGTNFSAEETPRPVEEISNIFIYADTVEDIENTTENSHVETTTSFNEISTVKASGEKDLTKDIEENITGANYIIDEENVTTINQSLNEETAKNTASVNHNISISPLLEETRDLTQEIEATTQVVTESEEIVKQLDEQVLFTNTNNKEEISNTSTQTGVLLHEELIQRVEETTEETINNDLYNITKHIVADFEVIRNRKDSIQEIQNTTQKIPIIENNSSSEAKIYNNTNEPNIDISMNALEENVIFKEMANNTNGNYDTSNTDILMNHNKNLEKEVEKTTTEYSTNEASLTATTILNEQNNFFINEITKFTEDTLFAPEIVTTESYAEEPLINVKQKQLDLRINENISKVDSARKESHLAEQETPVNEETTEGLQNNDSVIHDVIKKSEQTTQINEESTDRIATTSTEIDIREETIPNITPVEEIITQKPITEDEWMKIINSPPKDEEQHEEKMLELLDELIGLDTDYKATASLSRPKNNETTSTTIDPFDEVISNTTSEERSKVENSSSVTIQKITGNGRFDSKNISFIGNEDASEEIENSTEQVFRSTTENFVINYTQNSSESYETVKENRDNEENIISSIPIATDYEEMSNMKINRDKSASKSGINSHKIKQPDSLIVGNSKEESVEEYLLKLWPNLNQKERKALKILAKEIDIATLTQYDLKHLLNKAQKDENYEKISSEDTNIEDKIFTKTFDRTFLRTDEINENVEVCFSGIVGYQFILRKNEEIDSPKYLDEFNKICVKSYEPILTIQQESSFLEFKFKLLQDMITLHSIHINIKGKSEIDELFFDNMTIFHSLTGMPIIVDELSLENLQNQDDPMSGSKGLIVKLFNINLTTEMYLNGRLIADSSGNTEEGVATIIISASVGVFCVFFFLIFVLVYQFCLKNKSRRMIYILTHR